MSAATMPMRDTSTMLRRNLKHQLRAPSLMLMLLGIPVILLLVFVFVFGETMGAGLVESGASTTGAVGRTAYLEFLVPGMLLLSAASAGQGVAISVAMDVNRGIVNRFRTMAINPAALLTGHVTGTVLQTIIAVPIVLGVAVALGFRPEGGVLAWLGALGIVGMITTAFVWLSVALRLQSKTVEGASNAPMPLMLLPFLSSGFTPVETMPAGLRWFAEYQPFTPATDAVRGLLLGQPIGNAAWQTLAWSVGIRLIGYVWSRRLFAREPRQ